MIRALPLALLLACASASPPAVPPTAPAAAGATREVDVQTLQADLAAGKVPLLVDVRTPEEFAGGHVPGAKNIPLDSLNGQLATLGAPDQEVYVICEVGGRSARAADQLQQAGRKAVNVAGGTRAWKAAGLPVE